MSVSEVLKIVGDKVHNMHLIERDYFAVQLTSQSPWYEVLLDGMGRLAILRPCENEIGSFEDRMALEKAICVRSVVYRKYYGAMEHFWK